ncbi:hypothetical protein BC939DRAFT_453065 [Gamsiella multidivaricata]|uniref:uncharacterized protein n=1 Tax=Gamsiella multidivaricata TaxID=101098 RepID=UPI00221FB725|nr:uncharacterized protein BC939DRAFT_453065 [Gamsiella multidivaricata]KAI7822939.1 hypothetical protein BC939DRAFT_453065 [Gamsiella multidivaricata]
MRFYTFPLLAALSSVVLASESTTESCAGSLSCDAGYCCSSHGFCGRSPFHCGYSSGCNAGKGSCGVVVLDQQGLPSVIPYDILSKNSMDDLLVKLTNNGSHISPEEKNDGKTIDSVLRDGLAEKEKMLSATTAPPNPLSNSNATMTNISKSNPLSTATPSTAGKAPSTKTSGAERVIAGTTGAVFGALVWVVSNA